MLTFALAKGRLAEQTMERLAGVGISCDEMREPSRKLIFADGDLRFFLAKPSDVPTYVEHGAADVGVAGKDTLLEENRALYEVYDFGFGRCRMIAAGIANDAETTACSLDTAPNGVPDATPDVAERFARYCTAGTGLRVATKYPAIAAHYFHSLGITPEIIQLSGSVELAPIVGLADVIVDITETGSTLEANGLTILAEIMPLSARLIVNRVSMKLKYEQITAIIHQLKTNTPRL